MTRKSITAELLRQNAKWEKLIMQSKYDDSKELDTLKREEPKTISPSAGFMQVRSIKEAMECAKIIAASSFCPRNLANKPGDVVVALQFGQELGLKPMSSLQNIAVINGRPALWGDAVIAVCRQSPDWEYMTEEYNDTTKVARVAFKRKGEPKEFVGTFSEEDARRAGLWGKPGPWTTNPKQMIIWRAKHFGARAAYPDCLRGIYGAEEAMDIPVPRGTFVERITEEQIVILDELLGKTDTDPKSFCQYFHIEAYHDLTQEQYEQAIKMLNKKQGIPEP